MRLVRREPVRVYLYGVLGSVVALGGVYGVVTGEQAAVWLGVGVALLAVPGVEAARSKVSPVEPKDPPAPQF